MRHRKKNTSKLYAILIAILCFLSYNTVIAQPVKGTSQGDQRLINKHLDHLNQDSTDDDILIDKSQNKGDKNPTGLRTQYHTGKVTYSPDKKFKIFIFEGESCGGNCTPVYSGFIVLNTGKRLTLNYDPLPITHIYVLGDHQYLILQAGLSGGGNLVDDVIKANVIEIKADKIIVRPFMNTHHGYSEAPFDFYASQSQAISDMVKHYQKPQFFFDPKTKRLDYQYLKTKNGITSENPGPVYVCKGYLSYINGKMIFQGEKATVLK